ncbi:AAA family ATPase [Allorhodopirellula solitaria]|uniref:ATPase family associated with various cellular activities (AAA) n=1 Tax=Allorhodopirellula solitaria TaxID=2527987 RepID=A0A5C5YH04_9BACT|nr:MoxR family ATPase [Allorhodopirellula solitaria]TWT73871.1 ATPase family associated with various cellular activities (AAA) [Allorhodopirellula solitaria]
MSNIASPATASSDSAASPLEPVEAAWQQLQQVATELRTVIRGKDDVIEFVLISLLAEGSILLEDVPGVGKTTLAKSVARLIDLDYQRIQCTPDLLPGDILGGSIYRPAVGEFEFRPGPVFCNLLVADEINRASPRTQSALLEAMAETQVTIEGKRHDLKHPFIVIATQNPAGFEGTFPLPESQLDRFLFRLKMDYPDPESEVDLLIDQSDHEAVQDLEPIMHVDALEILQRWVREIRVDRKIASYIVALATATRRDGRLRVGCSPRGCKMLLRAAQGRAGLLGRDFVLPDDVQHLAVATLGHRVSSRHASSAMDENRQTIESIVKQTDIPL